MMKLSKLNKGLANQALNKAGASIQKKMKSKAKTMGSHKGGVAFNKKGQRIIDHNRTKKVYSRESMSTGRSLNPMGDLIKFRLYEESSILLAGWINTKSFTSLRFEGGVGRPFRRVKGVKAKALASKMAKGGRTSIREEAKLSGISYAKQRAIYLRSGWGSVVKKGYVMRKAYRFMTFSSYLLTAERVAKSEFESATKQFIRKVA